MNPLAKGLLTKMKQDDYQPVYVLQGEETYYINLLASYIRTHALTDKEKDFNQVILYGKETNVSTMLNHARRYPVMSTRQTVIVKEAQEIPDLQKGTGLQLMTNYLSHPNPSTVLVLCYNYKTLDKRGALGKLADKLAMSVTFKKMYDSQLPRFIYEYTQQKKIDIQEKAIAVLAEYIGNDLNRIVNEIDKILVSVKEKESITAENIMQHIGISKEYNIFELQKALITKNMKKALQIISYFDSNPRKNPIIPVLAFLYSFYSKLLIASSHPNTTPQQLTSLLKVSPYATQSYQDALRHYSKKHLIHCVQCIAKSDLQLKGINVGMLTPTQILSDLIYQLIYGNAISF